MDVAREQQKCCCFKEFRGDLKQVDIPHFAGGGKVRAVRPELLLVKTINKDHKFIKCLNSLINKNAFEYNAYRPLQRPLQWLSGGVCLGGVCPRGCLPRCRGCLLGGTGCLPRGRSLPRGVSAPVHAGIDPP